MKHMLSIFNERPNFITNFWPFFKFFSDFYVYSVLEKLAPPPNYMFQNCSDSERKNALLYSNSL